MSEPGFWDNKDKAQADVEKVSRLRGLLDDIDSSLSPPTGRAAALASIERLSGESVSLVFRVLLCNPSTMIELGARCAGAAAAAGSCPLHVALVGARRS